MLKDMLLTEKVTRNELSAALDNPNVRIGAEYEFIIGYDPEKEKKWIEYSNYITRLTKWEDTDSDDDPPEAPDWMLDAGYDPADDDVPDFEDLTGWSEKSHFLTKAKQFINGNPYLFQKGKFEITNNDKAPNTGKLLVKPDGTLGIDGVEITTPVMTLQDFLNFCPKMFEAINKNAETNDSCGFHISISLINIDNLEKSIDLVKLMVFLDEGYIYKNFDMRRFNKFAKSAHHKLYNEIIKNPESIEEYIEKKKDFPATHYDAINIEHLSSDNKYIEFRYIGGKNYHTKWDRIKMIIARYIYALSIACDPDYKRKEYLTKLSRIYNKIALFTIVAELNIMVTDGKTKTKEYKDLVNSWKTLDIYYKRFSEDEKNKDMQYNFVELAKKTGIRYMKKLQWDFSIEK